MVEKEVIQIKTCELYDLLSVKSVDFIIAYRLLGQMYNVIRYRHQLHHAKTPEAESLARWSLEDARDELDRTLRAMNLCELDKALVRYIADNCEFEYK